VVDSAALAASVKPPWAAEPAATAEPLEAADVVAGVGGTADDVAGVDAVPLALGLGFELLLVHATAPRAMTPTNATPVSDLRCIGTSPNRSASEPTIDFDRGISGTGGKASVV
jgi:hypothetical protein